ncbi:alkaline phosphatase D [[Emmonsia] crescens]|uniref:Alkaline phosphatase D n=1 Tax=[Emmonsia] crescens TaxID=73230 RepID=A0A2B7ZFA5_9EURO|nr:alkaline phosphatase D [Emmonsia crescens]
MGHHGLPLIFTSLLVYLTSIFVIVTSPVFKQSQRRDATTRNGRKDAIKAEGSLSSAGSSEAGKVGRAPSSLFVLSTGVPSTRARHANLATVGVNILLGLATLDTLLRGHYLYSTTDLAFSRVGYVSPTTANILIREPDAAKLPIHISYRAIENGREGELIEAGIISLLSNDTDYTHPVALTGLQPSMEYRYSFSNSLSGQFTTAAAPGSAAANRLTFLSSSCIKPNFPYNPLNHPLQVYGLELISKIVSKLPSFSRPSFMLFLGDFIYIDVPFRWGSSISDYRSEYRKVYASPSWHTGPEPAINIPWLHTLDDHEIANDWHLGNITDPYPAAFDTYRHYHMSINPPIDKSSFSIPSNTTYFSFTNGPASFFMLDTRTYRSEPLKGNSTMLGSAQLNSLLAFISRQEPAGVEWKIVTSSVPFTKNWRIGTEDTWGGFLGERRRIFEAIWRAERELGIRVVLLSGDRHEFGATRFPDLSLAATTGSKADEGGSSLEDGMGIHEFCTGPLNMFYVPFDCYLQTDNQDVLIKYLPAGNNKVGVINIDVENGRNSVLRYSLYIGEELVWEYKLATPLVWEEGQSRVLPPGEIVYDRFGDGTMVDKVKRVLGEAEVLVKPLIKRAVGAVKWLVLVVLKREIGPEV